MRGCGSGSSDHRGQSGERFGGGKTVCLVFRHKMIKGSDMTGWCPARASQGAALKRKAKRVVTLEQRVWDGPELLELVFFLLPRGAVVQT